MVKIKMIDALSLGKISGILYAFIGFIVGVIMSFVSIIGASLGEPEAGIFGALFGIGAIILFPILYGVMGFVGGLISALLYNLIAKWIGGVEIELETQKM